MGPPPFSDGNLLLHPFFKRRYTPFNGATAFQRWKQRIDRGVGRANLPSMGPPPFSDGNSETLEWPSSVMVLQWGHRLSAMETLRIMWDAVIGARPSMGPPPFSDGNFLLRLLVTGARHTFNGATAFQRWKRGNIVGGQEAEATFNGATAFQRWKLFKRVLVALWVIPFNGATAFQRWKPGMSRCQTCRAKNLQWGHRLSAMETWTLPPCPCPGATAFNGATAFQRWKHSVRVQPMSKSKGLQWGHRLSAMETPMPATVCRRSCQPSMGPPPFSDGNCQRRVSVPLSW